MVDQLALGQDLFPNISVFPLPITIAPMHQFLVYHLVRVQ
jgi:hypothetical protein